MRLTLSSKHFSLSLFVYLLSLFPTFIQFQVASSVVSSTINIVKSCVFGCGRVNDNENASRFHFLDTNFFATELVKAQWLPIFLSPISTNFYFFLYLSLTFSRFPLLKRSQEVCHWTPTPVHPAVHSLYICFGRPFISLFFSLLTSNSCLTRSLFAHSLIHSQTQWSVTVHPTDINLSETIPLDIAFCLKIHYYISSLTVKRKQKKKKPTTAKWDSGFCGFLQSVRLNCIPWNSIRCVELCSAKRLEGWKLNFGNHLSKNANPRFWMLSSVIRTCLSLSLSLPLLRCAITRLSWTKTSPKHDPFSIENFACECGGKEKLRIKKSHIEILLKKKKENKI